MVLNLPFGDEKWIAFPKYAVISNKKMQDVLHSMAVHIKNGITTLFIGNNLYPLQIIHKQHTLSFVFLIK
jgi:hypothetical protein